MCLSNGNCRCFGYDSAIGCDFAVLRGFLSQLHGLRGTKPVCHGGESTSFADAIDFARDDLGGISFILAGLPSLCQRCCWSCSFGHRSGCSIWEICVHTRYSYAFHFFLPHPRLRNCCCLHPARGFFVPDLGLRGIAFLCAREVRSYAEMGHFCRYSRCAYAELFWISLRFVTAR